MDHGLLQMSNRPNPADLDNLLKPILDTVFTSENVKGPTKALVDANDTNVFEVCARKTRAFSSQGQGVDITVSWTE